VPSFAEHINAKRIVFLESTTKKAALQEMVNALANDGVLQDPAWFLQAIYEREELMPTALGIGIAVPHAKVPRGQSFGLALGLHTEGIEFGALDGQPVQVIVMIAQPVNETERYLRFLAQIATFLKNPGNFNAILGAPDEQAVVDIVRNA